MLWWVRQNQIFLLSFRYNLLFYINPQFYGYAAIAKILLLNVRLKCEYESTLNCLSTDGNAVLARFGLETVNPYEHLVVSINVINNDQAASSMKKLIDLKKPNIIWEEMTS